ncbi:MAG: UDP-3-O-(3-hydroxymyristoyl)glucosamine N-acyltransferase [Pseudomonadota bacterium]
MTYSISDIAAALGADAMGDGDLVISAVAEPAMASADELALAMDEKYAADLAKGAAQAAMLWPGADWKALGLKAAIIAPRPRFALAGLSARMDPGQGFGPGIHASAIVDDSADLAVDVTVGPFSIISAGAQIGAGSVIGPGCFIGMDARISAQAYLREHVSIGARVKIGARFIAQPGVRIGGDGFSFVTAEKSAVETVRETLGEQGESDAQSWTRIHSLGSVTIGADVEIGANACVDCGTIRDTAIGDGCKIDNLVQIGHNVIIGQDCMICAQSGIAGSSRLGNNVVLGGHTGVSDNVFIGDRAITGGATVVLSNIPAGRVMLGYPAVKMDTQLEIHKAQRRLPRLARDVAELKSAVFKPGQSD